ncbi:MAG: hypothetical protein Q6L49_03740 [Thermostichales cyanobacterium HHBFW_bins_127]
MTAQIPDTLILDGKHHGLFCHLSLPINHPQISLRPQAEMDEEDRDCYSTACWREYVATWEIRNQRLYLNEIRGTWRLTGDPIFADWITDELIIPMGECLVYVHMGFGSVYEREKRITVEKGVVTQVEVIENDPNVDPWQRGLEHLPGMERISRLLRDLEGL